MERRRLGRRHRHRELAGREPRLDVHGLGEDLRSKRPRIFVRPR
jgi:hypothetical protein